MPAYNPPAQVLISPVSSMYEGKAIRQGLALNEAKLKTAQKSLDQMDDRLELDKKQVENQTANVEMRVKEYAAKVGAERALSEANQIIGITEAASSAEDPVAYANERMPEFIASLPKDSEGRKKLEEIAENGFTAAEMKELHTVAMATRGQFGGKSQIQKHIDALVESEAITREEGNELLKNSVIKAGTITGTTEFDSQRDPRTNSQKGAAHQNNVDAFNSSSDVQEMIGSALPQIIEMPSTVGIRGKVATGVAGLFAALGQDELADKFSQYMAGATQEEIAQIQVQLQAIRGRIIPIVTGEEGKRLSEMEREIASKAVGLIDSIQGPADLTKAYPQVIGAMKQLYAESWASKYRVASQDENINYPYDLSQKKDLLEIFTEFADAGIDINTAKRTVVRLKSIQGVD